MNRARIEELLVGVALPATKQQLVDYARAQPGGSVAAQRLQQIPDREYALIQEAGEELEPVQPDRSSPRIEPPKPESGPPPGGAAYTGGTVTPPNVEAYRQMTSKQP
jgi:hypothetical protein